MCQIQIEKGHVLSPLLMCKQTWALSPPEKSGSNDWEGGLGDGSEQQQPTISGDGLGAVSYTHLTLPTMPDV